MAIFQRSAYGRTVAKRTLQAAAMVMARHAADNFALVRACSSSGWIESPLLINLFKGTLLADP